MAEPLGFRRWFSTLKASSEFPWLIMCAVALVIVIYPSLSDWQQVREANEEARLSDESIRQVHLLSVSVQEAESSQRGCLLTGEASYLKPYLANKARIDSLLEGIRRLPGI